ncbi:hypothetical protein RclHR1_01900027 [Rhizophagus clarus]|uniref:Uncharacterized protein n=1 Tax=Rhizophagus clarus TaxID=94130 RepID=A0A2Z6QSV9_9GLOM|nr:hypothetical protein RclHR1_01900027 [Rhizophagus clarus]
MAQMPKDHADLPDLDMEMDRPHQSTSLTADPPPLSSETSNTSWKLVLTKNQKKKLKKQEKRAEKAKFLQEVISLNSSTASPDSTLDSHKPTLSQPPPHTSANAKRSDKSDDKIATLTTKKRKNESSTGDNNVIITGYQPEENDKNLTLDLVVYDIPAKWTNYQLLSELNKWGKVVSVSTRVQKKYQTARTELAWCKHSTPSFHSSRRQPKVSGSGSTSSSFKKVGSFPVITGSNRMPLRSCKSQINNKHENNTNSSNLAQSQNSSGRSAFINTTKGSRKSSKGQSVVNEPGGCLCLTCNDYGYTPFESLITIAHNTFQQKDQLNNVLQKIDTLKRHLRRGYERELMVNADSTIEHDPCISHCLPYAFDDCYKIHNSRCSKCDQFFKFFGFMHSHIKEDQMTTLEEAKEHLQYFLAHSTRKVYLNTQFKAILTTLDDDGALLVADYKMRILPKFAQKIKAEFFAYDHWSSDTKQDAWFTASVFEAVFEVIKYKPKWIRIISDNGSHYHSSKLMAIVAHWNEWYQIEVCDWLFLEPGEDIVEAAKHLSGTLLANLEPDRESNIKVNVKTIKGISNLFYWKWPVSDIVDAIIPEFMDDGKNNELKDASSVDIQFQFSIRWILKSNQKFGKKEKEKE